MYFHNAVQYWCGNLILWRVSSVEPAVAWTFVQTTSNERSVSTWSLHDQLCSESFQNRSKKDPRSFLNKTLPNLDCPFDTLFTSHSSIVIDATRFWRVCLDFQHINMQKRLFSHNAFRYKRQYVFDKRRVFQGLMEFEGDLTSVTPAAVSVWRTLVHRNLYEGCNSDKKYFHTNPFKFPIINAVILFVNIVKVVRFMKVPK